MTKRAARKPPFFSKPQKGSTMMTETESKLMDKGEYIKLVPLKDVLRHKFFIPKYQRGYRWGKEQTVALLNDLFEFYEKTNKKNNETTNNAKKDEIYCLQPLVIKQNREYWNVVDGQQRLTTLYILFKYLDKNIIDNNFELQYESRQKAGMNSWEFLKELTESDRQSDDSIYEHGPDYYHMYCVKKAISEWKPDNNPDEWNKDLKSKFLTLIRERVNFIVYCLREDDEIEVFKRLNIGKIRLTESELVRAIFLNSSNNGKDEQRILTVIANEWDQIEYRLQDDRFWMFVHEKQYDRPTRIDFVLDIAKKVKSEGRTEGSNAENRPGPEQLNDSSTPVFDYYYKEYKKNPKTFVENCWKYIHKVFGILCEWYNDEKLYHYIGFLSTVNAERKEKSSEELMKDLINNRMDCASKDGFSKKVQCDIKDRIDKQVWDLDFEYEQPKGKGKKEARPLLLLHNIQTVIDQNACLSQEKKYQLPDFIRFPFHLYRKERWDIEHIRPNNPLDFEGPRKKNLRRKYAYVLENGLSDAFLNRQIRKNDLSGLGISQDLINRFFSTTQKNEPNLKGIIEFYKKIYKDLIDQTNKDKDVEKQESDWFNFLWGAADFVTQAASDELSEEDKNKIWNYVLLDASTNREYGNSAYTIKRDFIMKKEKGIKPNLQVKEDCEIEKTEFPETAFVPVCTMRVFAKSYTEYSDNLQYWTRKDAAYYRMDIEQRLWWYLFDKEDKVTNSLLINYNLLKKKELDNDDKLKKSIFDGLFQAYKKYIDNSGNYATSMKKYCAEVLSKDQKKKKELRRKLVDETIWEKLYEKISRLRPKSGNIIKEAENTDWKDTDKRAFFDHLYEDYANNQEDNQDISSYYRSLILEQKKQILNSFQSKQDEKKQKS